MPRTAAIRTASSRHSELKLVTVLVMGKAADPRGGCGLDGGLVKRLERVRTTPRCA